MSVRLETRRLIVREFTPADLDQISQIFGDPQVMWLKPRPLTREQARQWLDDAIEHHRCDGMGEYAVVLRSTGRVIGDCGLVLREIEGEKLPEFGWDLRRDAWGHGYATEAARAVLGHAGGLGLRRVCALIKMQNSRSKRVAERLGLKFDRCVRWESSLWELWLADVPRRVACGSETSDTWSGPPVAAQQVLGRGDRSKTLPTSRKGEAEWDRSAVWSE